MSSTAWRLPAEWEAQDAVLIAWPHAGTDWASRLARVEAAYVELAAAISRFEPLLICVADSRVRERARDLLAGRGLDETRLRFIEVTYDDTWLRDSGPLSLVGAEGHRLLDFRFTGWGGKYGASRDDRLVENLVAMGLFRTVAYERIDFAMEGGAIESDGAGNLLSTWRCLSERHPQLDRSQIEARLAAAFRLSGVLWLEHGELEGDDTDAHVDTLARFAPDGVIVYQACDDPADSHHAELSRMAEELAALRDPQGRPWRLHALPWARPIVDEGRRLPASYANYLIVNGGVIAPAYGDPADRRAAEVIARAHPGREVVQVDARPFIWQNGSVHCLTMQLPAGLLASV